MARPITVLDTCCLINICAIDRPLEQVLGGLPFQMFVAAAVEREEISIRPSVTAAKHERRRVDLQPCIDSGLLNRCLPETDQERDLYVSLTLRIQDGEAMSLSIASSRGWAIATDDKPARRLAAELGVQVLGTPELVRLWAEASSLPKDLLAGSITRIEQLARYVPTADLPAFDWWSRSRG